MAKFTDCNALVDEKIIPKRWKDRVVTDKKFFYFFWICIFCLVTFLAVNFHSVDIGTPRFKNYTSTITDFTDRAGSKMEQTLVIPRENFQQANRKNATQSYTDMANMLEKSRENQQGTATNTTHGYKYSYTLHYPNNATATALKIVFACLSSICITFVTVYLFKVWTSYVVWTFLITILLFAAIGLGFLWYIYSILICELHDRLYGLFLFINIFLSVLLFIYTCVLIFMRKRIKMIILLFTESCKVLFAIPSLLIIPILKFLANLLILVMLICTTVMLFSSGTKKELPTGDVVSELSYFAIFTIIFNVLVASWSSTIIADLQYTITACATSMWYFAKNKNYIIKPLSTSTYIVFKYHLGTEVLGALVITIATILRGLLHFFTNNKCMNCLLRECRELIEIQLRIFTKNAYILTAIYGTSFIKSGKRAAEIIVKNAFHLICHDYIGSFILGIIKLSIVLINMAITYFFMKDETFNDVTCVAYVIVFLISCMVASAVLSIFHGIIDTIFICFCEDFLINDGVARPYAMTRDLMEFIDYSKKVREVPEEIKK